MLCALAALSLLPIRIEAESGELVGVQVSTTRAGFSGKGYVTGFDADGDKVVFRFTSRPGVYLARALYRSPGQQKGVQLKVNAVGSDGMLQPTSDSFKWQSLGRVELASSNVVEFRKGWGYYDLDAIEFVPAPSPPALKSVPARLTNPSADSKAKALFLRLRKAYGLKTLSGQYEIAEAGYVKAKTGKRPSILGGDFMEYSPSRLEIGSMTGNLSEKMIQEANKGSVVSLSWHWNAPTGLIDKMIKDSQGREVDARWYKGFYTNATTFDLSKAFAPGSAGYELLLRDIDRIALELKKFQKAGVPMLWRPLHEAEGGWFWWGAKGAEPFKKLWVLMHDRMTRVHKLNNLIWVYSSGTKKEWYPGDRYVDIVGIDAYPADRSDALTGTWDELLARFNGRKLLALTEFGGVPDVDRMWRLGVRWSFFLTWVGGLGPKSEPDERLKRIYRSARL